MDFDLSLTDLDAAAAAAPLDDAPSLSMQNINLPNMPAIHPLIASADAPAWTPAPNDLVPVPVPLSETLALAGLPQAAIAELTAPIPLPPPSSVGQKRSHAQMDAAPTELSTSHTTQLDSSNSAACPPPASSHSVSHSRPVQIKQAPEEECTPATAAATAAAAAAVPAEMLPQPEIDAHAVCQMGGLPYAELCKERAREEFKEAKRNEHLANGDFDRTKRRKKNDTSMTPRQKYIRRLRMNQDSAAAARHAQEVYVTVLEKLVKTSEAEKKTFSLEMQHIRKQNVMLQSKVQDLQDRVNELEDEQTQQAAPPPAPEVAEQPPAFDWEKTKDPILASKLLDFIASTPMMPAQVDLGVQPARAV